MRLRYCPAGSAHAEAPCTALGDAVLKVREAIAIASGIDAIYAASLSAVQEDADQVAALLEDALPFIEAAAGMTRDDFAGVYSAPVA